MLAYHNDPALKAATVAEMIAHREADNFINGTYWDADIGKGCAVGCLIKSGNHIEYEARFGIPVMLARLEDVIFEGLPDDLGKAWPVRFVSAPEVGADLSRVCWQFLHWLLTDETVNPGINHPSVKGDVSRCAGIMARLAAGGTVSRDDARAAAAAAEARAARAAREAEARAAWAWAAAAARAAEAAVWAAVWGAAEAAEAADAWEAGRKTAYVLMADKMIELMQDAQPPP